MAFSPVEAAECIVYDRKDQSQWKWDFRKQLQLHALYCDSWQNASLSVNSMADTQILAEMGIPTKAAHRHSCASVKTLV